MTRYVLTHTGSAIIGGSVVPGTSQVTGTTAGEIRRQLEDEFTRLWRGRSPTVYVTRFRAILDLLDAADPVAAFAARFGESNEGSLIQPSAYLLTDDEFERRHTQYIGSYNQFLQRIGGAS